MSTPERLRAKIIICLDGTSNSAYIGGIPLTNVTRIARCIKPTDEKGRRQIVWYHPGIGTGFINPFNVLHQISGNGLKDIIVAAYLFLCNNYNPEDEIFLIGFSRGAFAIRCLANFIQQHGVLPREEVHHVNDLYGRWKTGNLAGPAVSPVPITACALWDTVGAVGIPLRGGTLRRKFPFIHSDIIDSVGHVYQALALHERRHHFFPIVLKRPVTPTNAPNLEQCWFGGFHSEVGGGNEHDALAHLALIWVMSKLGQWIDTDTAGLLGPATGQSTWRVPQRKNAYFRPANLKKILFKIMGFKYRVPNYEFWGEAGVYNCPIPNNGETIHKSTGKLIESGQLKLPHAAANTPPPWVFRPGSSSDEAQLSAAEDTVDPEERKLLLEWVGAEYMQLHDTDHRAGTAAPDTILAQVRAWFPEPLV